MSPQQARDDLRGRGPIRGLLTGLIAVVLGSTVTGVVAADAAHAQPQSKPTIASVTHRLDRLANTAERLAEQYNAAQLKVSRQQRTYRTARNASASASARFQAAQRQLAAVSLAQYEGGAISHTGALLTSGSADAYLTTLADQDLLISHSAAVTSLVDQAAQHARQARAWAAERLAATRRTLHALDGKRARVRDQTSRYKTLLATLTAAQQAAYRRRQQATPAQVRSVAAPHAGNAAAQRAVDFALAQVGKPYVWAAAGPDSYDCSGLTMSAWAQGGVTLPHYAAAQYGYGTHVAYSDLQPGDLVFLYTDLHHVEIYIGKGLAVSAPQPGENVKIVRVADYRADFYGATRLS